MTHVPPVPPVPGARRAAVPRARTVLVAGVSGGTGTTTVAALLADAAGVRHGGADQGGGAQRGVVQASDHSGGALAARLPRLDAATSRDTVHDAGAHVLPAARLAAAPEDGLVVVGRTTPDGAQDARAALDALTGADAALLPRTVLVLVSRNPRTPQPDLAPLQAVGLAAVVVLPWDRTLARPGRIAPSSLSRATAQVVDTVLTALRW